MSMFHVVSTIASEWLRSRPAIQAGACVLVVYFFFTAVRTVVINVFFKDSLSSSLTRTSCCTGAASMSSQKKARGLPGMKEGPLVQMLDRQRVQQAAADAAWTQASIDTPYPPDASGPGN